MQPASASPYPFDTQYATLKMEDMVDIFAELDSLQKEGRVGRDD